ncbi:7277_t:CDS:2 [Ambispora gerdemannii]|uniref:7277_t:CDS:1 n=1 Tax=Ambispora gerdemannii TaxID=144530 RepID=A0A9N9B356_9GLOM|nr:7277_t:CDS:2 [Ambispora gerdemannii]
MSSWIFLICNIEADNSFYVLECTAPGKGALPRTKVGGCITTVVIFFMIFRFTALSKDVLPEVLQASKVKKE